MSLAFCAIVFLIVAGPVFTLVGGPFATSIQMLIAAFSLVSIAISARSADIGHFSRVTSGILWILVLAPSWMLIQLLPLPLPLSHPIWTSAHEALPSGSWGHITVDIGETFRALFSILALSAILCVTMLVARDRRRAELVLFAIAVVTTVLALTALIQKAGFLPVATAASMLSSGFGLVAGLATIALAFERRETRHQAAPQYMLVGAGGLVATVINGLALQQTGGAASPTVAGFGTAIFLLVLLIRRLDLARWPIVVLCVATGAGVVIMVAWLFEQQASVSALLRFPPAQPAEAVALFERMLADTRWLGSGAGTFTRLARIYQISDAQGAIMAPTAMIAVAVEIGWIGLLGIVAIGCALVAKLFSGALARGRDWFFSAAAAACVVIALCQAFVDASLLQPASAAICAVVIGLGLTQTSSQTGRL